MRTNITVPVRQIGLLGEIKDMHAHDIPANALANAVSCRIEDQSIASMSKASEFLEDVADETFLFGHEFRLEGNLGQVIVSLDSSGTPAIKVEHVAADGTKTVVTPSGGLSTAAEVWYAVQLGNWFILTNDSGVDNPQLLDETLGLMVDLPGWPTNYKCRVMEKYKNFLVALGVSKTSGSGDEGRMVKWCDPVGNAATTTDWDHTSTTNLAGESVLLEPGRDIIGGHEVNDSFMIYFDQRTWRADFTRSTAVFAFKQVFNDDGMVGAHSKVTTHDGAIVFGYRDVYIHNGNTKRSLTDTINQRDTYDSVDLNWGPVGVWYPKRNEVLFACRTNSDGDGNQILIWNALHNAWTRVMAEVNTDGVISHMYVGPRPTASAPVISDWTTETYDDMGDTTYADLANNDLTETIFVVSADQGVVWDFDDNNGSVEIFKKEALINHLALDFEGMPDSKGKQVSVGNKIVYLSRVFPQIAGTGVVKFTLGAKMTPQGSIAWNDPVTYDLDDANKYAIDDRIAGRYLAYQLESNDPENPATFCLSGLDFEIQVAGRR